MFNVNLSGIGEATSGIGSLAKDIRSAITGQLSPEKQAELETKLAELEATASSAQTDINKVEAGSSNWFIAGWRPAVGWICAFGLFYGTVGKPFLEMLANLCGYSGEFPSIDSTTLTTTLYGMLGLGTLRTVEKLKSASNNH